MNLINLEGSRILYIGPVGFYYDRSFVEKLRSLGASVDTHNLCPNSLDFRLKKKLHFINIGYYLDNYHAAALVKGDYQYVLVRHGYQLSTSFLKNLRKRNPDARFINFHWDSIKPHYNYLSIRPYFDKVFSFDYKDCDEHKWINYLPLFFIDEYATSPSENSSSVDFDLVFVGSWRDAERYNMIKSTDHYCKKAGLKFYYYLNYSYKEQFNLVKKGIRAKEAKHRSLSYQDIVKLFSSSSSVIDFPSSFQTGLTIRTFEALGAGKKLITTNKNIKKEPFYDPEYISVIDTNRIEIDSDFIKKTPAIDLSSKIQEYSVGGYITKLLS